MRTGTASRSRSARALLVLLALGGCTLTARRELVIGWGRGAECSHGSFTRDQGNGGVDGGIVGSLGDGGIE